MEKVLTAIGASDAGRKAKDTAQGQGIHRLPPRSIQKRMGYFGIVRTLKQAKEEPARKQSTIGVYNTLEHCHDTPKGKHGGQHKIRADCLTIRPRLAFHVKEPRWARIVP